VEYARDYTSVIVPRGKDKGGGGGVVGGGGGGGGGGGELSRDLRECTKSYLVNTFGKTGAWKWLYKIMVGKRIIEKISE